MGLGSRERVTGNREDFWLADSGEENTRVRAAVSWGTSKTSLFGLRRLLHLGNCNELSNGKLATLNNSRVYSELCLGLTEVIKVFTLHRSSFSSRSRDEASTEEENFRILTWQSRIRSSENLSQLKSSLFILKSHKTSISVCFDVFDLSHYHLYYFPKNLLYQ